MFGWWAALVLTGYLMYFPEVLGRIKFTQALVGHSHLAMAGFTTAFCGLLSVLLTHRRLASTWTVILWNGATLLMVVALAASGWREGAEPSWMLTAPGWREFGLLVRALCGVVLVSLSVIWLKNWRAA